MLLDSALTLVIPSSATRDMNYEDLGKLVDTYAIAEQAKNDFLAQKITFDEYLQLLEMAQVNIDNYAQSLEHNLEILKVL